MGDITATFGFPDAPPPPTQPFWAKCRICAHCWPAAYLPMDMAMLGKVMKRVMCPKCGDTKPVVAKQNKGVLQEPTA